MLVLSRLKLLDFLEYTTLFKIFYGFFEVLHIKIDFAVKFYPQKQYCYCVNF